MKSTGLKDKNGKVIKAGHKVISEIIHLHEDEDILKEPATVVYKQSLASFALEKNGRFTLLSEILCGWKPTVLEIVNPKAKD